MKLIAAVFLVLGIAACSEKSSVTPQSGVGSSGGAPVSTATADSPAPASSISAEKPASPVAATSNEDKEKAMAEAKDAAKSEGKGE